RLGGGLLVARSHFAKAIAPADDPKKRAEVIAQLTRVDKDCDEERCSMVRRHALKALGWQYAENDDPVGAAKAMLEEMKLAAAAMPPERRAYARTTEVEKTCAAVDDQQGPGTCRQLEKSVVGSYTFTDFSSQRVRELSPDRVKQVNDHFGVTLQDCLA